MAQSSPGSFDIRICQTTLISMIRFWGGPYASICRIVLVSPGCGLCLGFRRYHSSAAIHPRIITPPITPLAIPPCQTITRSKPVQSLKVSHSYSCSQPQTTVIIPLKRHTLVLADVAVGLDKSVGNPIQVSSTS
jgi:hypothetical protein